MVRVKDFCGAVFHPKDYEHFLHSNIEHLQATPMGHSFRTSEMISEGQLFKEQEPFFYIYRQIYLNHTSYGILAEISLKDYQNNHIKRHEKTLHRPAFNHETYMHDHVGPVVVSHRKNLAIDELIALNAKTNKEAFSEWVTKDGRQHTLWKVKAEQTGLRQQFRKIESLYILDGHHRLQAAHQNYLLSDKTQERDLWIQALIYSSEYVSIHPQHRVIENLPRKINVGEELLKLSHIQVTELENLNFLTFNIGFQLERYEVIFKVRERAYGINFKITSKNILEEISSFRLQEQIFAKFLDEECLRDLKYVPGIINEEELLDNEVIVFIRQLKIQTLFKVADLEITVPPKSTWIEPKPCSHMVIRLVSE